MTTAMLVALGENEIKTLDDFGEGPRKLRQLLTVFVQPFLV